MKKLFLTIAVFGALATTAIAQDARKAGTNNQSELTIEQRVDKQTTKATTALGLSEAQQVTFKKLVTERITANKSIRDKAKASNDKAEKKGLHEQIKANNEKFFASVNSMLTPEQQTKWANHRKKMQEKNKDIDHD